MRDPEFIELRNKFLLGIGILIIFAIPIFFFVKNKLYMPDSKIMKYLKKNDSMVILVIENKCDRCNKSREVLNELNVNYFILNKDTERDYNSIIRKLNIEDEIQVQSIIYVDEGNLYSYIYNIRNKKEITDFVENYNLNGGN